MAVSGLARAGTIHRTNLERAISQLGLTRPKWQKNSDTWHHGKPVLHPADRPCCRPRKLSEVFFHKIVAVRNQLRCWSRRSTRTKTLRRRKVDMQQYITRRYGSPDPPSTCCSGQGRADLRKTPRELDSPAASSKPFSPAISPQTSSRQWLSCGRRSRRSCFTMAFTVSARVFGT